MERMLQDIDKVSAPGSSVTIVSKRVNKRLRDEAFQYQYDSDSAIFLPSLRIHKCGRRTARTDVGFNDYGT